MCVAGEQTGDEGRFLRDTLDLNSLIRADRQPGATAELEPLMEFTRVTWRRWENIVHSSGGLLLLKIMMTMVMLRGIRREREKEKK